MPTTLYTHITNCKQYIQEMMGLYSVALVYKRGQFIYTGLQGTHTFLKESAGTSMKTLILILVLACSTYVGLAAPSAAQDKLDIHNLRAMLDKVLQQNDLDDDIEVLNAAAQDDDDDTDEAAQELDSILANMQDSDEEVMAKEQAPQDSAETQRRRRRSYYWLYWRARRYLTASTTMMNKLFNSIRNYRRTMGRYSVYLRNYYYYG